MKNYDFMGLGYKYVMAISRKMGNAFTREENDDAVIYKLNGERDFLKLVDDSSQLVTVFYVPVPSLHKENRVQKIAPHTWQYNTTKVEELYALIEIALNTNHIEHSFELNKQKSTPSNK